MTRFAAVNLDKKKDTELPGFSQVIENLAQDDKQRTEFLKACLIKLGLQVSQDLNAVPSLSRLHLSSVLPSATSEFVASLEDIITVDDGEEYIEDDNDTFHIEKPSTWSISTRINSRRAKENEKTDSEDNNEDRILNYSTILKRMVIHDNDCPSSKETPYFNHHAYFANLKHYQSKSSEEGDKFGNLILYGEVVTSTNTILEKYDHRLPLKPYSKIRTKLIQEYSTSSTNTHRVNRNGNHTSGRSRARQQCLGFSTRITDYLDRYPSSNFLGYPCSGCVSSIPCRSCGC